MPNQEEQSKPKRGGRSPMGVKPTLVRLPLGVPERIDALEGPNRRAEFIRDAVVAELARRQASQTLGEPDPDPETPPAP